MCGLYFTWFDIFNAQDLSFTFSMIIGNFDVVCITFVEK